MQRNSNKDRNPLVSVIIPTHNAGKFIAQALQTVLDQTYAQYEVTVVDDGSTDETKDILREFDGSIRYLYQDNRGPSAARNAGIRIAQGDYICFLDADDLWVPNKLESQIAFFEEHADIGLVFSDEEEISTHGTTRHSRLARSRFCSDLVGHAPVRTAFQKLLIENFIPTSTVMIRKECFAKAGLFDQTLTVVEDRDLWLRIAAHFEIACLPRVLGKKLEHERNISGNSQLNLCSRLKVWQKMRREFPHLTPRIVVKGLSAEAYLQLAYILAAKDERRQARAAAIRSLGCAIWQILPVGLDRSAIPPYDWRLAAGFLPIALLGFSAARSLRRL